MKMMILMVMMMIMTIMMKMEIGETEKYTNLRQDKDGSNGNNSYGCNGAYV